MSEPLRPLRESAPEGDRTAQLLKLTAEIAPRPVDVGKGWDGVIERVARPKSSRVLWLSLGTAAALLVVAALQLTHSTRPETGPVKPLVQPEVAATALDEQTGDGVEHPPLKVIPGSPFREKVRRVPQAQKPKLEVAAPSPAPSPEPAPEVEAPKPPPFVAPQAGALWAYGEDASFSLERGKVEVQRHPEKMTIVTPEVTLAASDSRFLADVTSSGTFVRVFEGQVEVGFKGESEWLKAGDERTFAASSSASALDVVPPEASSPSCARQGLEQRLACLANEARGDGFKAQAALYERAYLLARAGRAPTAELTLRESLRRFPHGVLEPEVRLSLIKSLTQQNRLNDAALAGKEFLAACGQDPRVGDVESFIRTVEWLEFR